MNLKEILEKESANLITPKIVEVIDRKNKEVYNSGSKTRRFSPSKLANGCRRALVLHMQGCERNATVFPAKLRRIWDTGHYLEDQLLDYLKGYYGDCLKTQVLLIDDDLLIKGYADGVIEANDKKVGIEIKTANDRRFMMMKKQGPPIEYVWQACMYYKVLKLDRLVWLFYNKNNSDLYELEYQHDEKVWEEIVKVITDTTVRTVEDNLPPMLSKCVPCGNMECEYSDICIERSWDDASKRNSKKAT